MRLHIVKTKEDMIELRRYHTVSILGREWDDTLREAVENTIHIDMATIPKGRVLVVSETNDRRLDFPGVVVDEVALNNLLKH